MESTSGVATAMKLEGLVLRIGALLPLANVLVVIVDASVLSFA
jgi:hypothetical protein